MGMNTTSARRARDRFTAYPGATDIFFAPSASWPSLNVLPAILLR
jgi:hypothetical protein